MVGFFIIIYTGGENVDLLILTFNKEQLKTYNELLKKENIELTFDTTLPAIDRFYVIPFDDVLSNMEAEAQTLLNLNKRNSSFAAFFTQDEIKELIPIYYNAIRGIKRHSNIIGAEAWKLSFKLEEIDKALANIHKRYADFFPYKAALCNREEYALKIGEIDAQFKKNIETLENFKNKVLSLFERAEILTDVVSDFIKKSSKATDEPKFKKFDAYDFFWTVEAFVEQIKNI